MCFHPDNHWVLLNVITSLDSYSKPTKASLGKFCSFALCSKDTQPALHQRIALFRLERRLKFALKIHYLAFSKCLIWKTCSEPSSDIGGTILYCLLLSALRLSGCNFVHDFTGQNPYMSSLAKQYFAPSTCKMKMSANPTSQNLQPLKK